MLWIKIGTKASTPRESVLLKNFDDLKYFWFAGHNAVPVGIVSEVSYVDGDSVAVLTNTVGEVASRDGIFASPSIHRSKLHDMRA